MAIFADIDSSFKMMKEMSASRVVKHEIGNKHCFFSCRPPLVKTKQINKKQKTKNKRNKEVKQQFLDSWQRVACNEDR
jgi:hypothetical protein